MSTKFRLNRYNWLGQKLLVQHEYGEIIRLRQYLVGSGEQDRDSMVACSRRLTSDHFSYIHGLALMKTSTHLDEIILALQRLNFDKNNQYFLLLCNCLLYSGNYDSVVALCKQVINKEIDAIGSGTEHDTTDEFMGEDESDELLVELGDKESTSDLDRITKKHDHGSKRKFGLDKVVQESFEFKKIFDNINRNHLINEPRLWFTFGLCLEYQRQHKDAHFAFRIAAKLASGSPVGSPPKRVAPMVDTSAQADTRGFNETQVSMSNYYGPHIKLAGFCIKHKADFRSSIQVLNQGRQLCPYEYNLNTMLALCTSGQPNCNQANFAAALDILSSLEAHSITNRNPSSGYNRLALKCMKKLRPSIVLPTFRAAETATGDEDRTNLNYLLVKAFVLINNLVQESGGCTRREDHEDDSSRFGIAAQLDKLIETIRNADPACRTSASLWNNLGLCYLIKRRFIACFSCLSKAQQINPIDWRINYNLAAACVHVGLYSKAIICLLAAKNFFATSQQVTKTNKAIQNHPLITTLMAVCYEKLAKVDESRRLHIESIRSNGGATSNMPIISLINYLIFLHTNSGQSDEQHVKIKLHLLDQLEHCWLQRDQNDPQFTPQILNIAQLIGQETLSNQSVRKTYAWTKSMAGIETKL